MPDSTSYRLEFDQSRAIVTLLPALNEVPWSEIERVGGDVVSQLANLPTPRLLVDLTPLNYMGSAQVALVVRMFKAVKERGGTLVVANRHPLVLEVLTLAGLNKLWTIVETRERGLKVLGGGTPPVQQGGGVASSIGLLALVAASAAVVAIFTQAAWLPLPTALILELGAGGVAFVCGLLAVLKGSRTIGACVLLGSLAVLLAGVFSLGIMKSQPGPAASPPTSADQPGSSSLTTDG